MKQKMPVYYQCNMKKQQHILVYIMCSLLVSVVVYLFYHMILISLVIGFLAGIYLEKMYADSAIKKRQKVLRLQFRDFLEAMSVSAANKTGISVLESALKDLQMSYNDKADIVCEVKNIILQYEKGGIEIKRLFEELADRSGLEDIRSFATIYSVIEGKSDRFGDIVTQTYEIIGEKIEIEQEIETTITSAKSETMVMLVMPIIIVVAMSSMGGGLMEALFTTWTGHLAATAALVIFAISFILAVKGSNIEV